MLIEFRVKNYKSLRDEQVLSLVASKDKELLDSNTMKTGLRAAPSVLRSAVIYGANASGKSNVVKALQLMRGVVVESATILQPGQPFNVQPFRLDEESAAAPTEFEITFVLEGVRYQYGFSLTTQRVVSEHLLVYKAFKPQRWFARSFDEEAGKDVYEFGPGLKGPKSVWEGATRPNALFLSMAVQLNSEQLRPVFDWFTEKLLIINEITPLDFQYSIHLLKEESIRKAILYFLSAADVSISDITIETRMVPGKTLKFDALTGKTEVSPEEVEHARVKFQHTTEKGSATFDLVDESNGTRNLLSLSGPVLDVLKRGVTFVVDELDTSLHTLIVRQLVRLFHLPEVNAKGAQLVFTTHDTSLLDATDLLRRDQIWFVEKKGDQASTLYGLSDFSPRKTEALERGYLTGRYGGVPFLSPFVGA
jgi:AAA15 family ATPase/GTPase